MLENDITVKRLSTFSLQSRTRQGSLLLPPLFNIVLQFLAREIGNGNYIKDNQIEKESVKLPLWADDMTLYAENPKDTTKYPVRTNKQIWQSSRKQS